jgi:hypothetical protein
MGEASEMGSSAKASGQRVVLAVNGARYEAAGVELSMPLLEFLRTRTNVRGPKLGCGEGEPPPTTHRQILLDRCDDQCLPIFICFFLLALFYSFHPQIAASTFYLKYM